MDIEVFIKQRKKKNLSQVELSKGICTQATLSRFENQGKVPSLKILTELCNRLELSLDRLFLNEGIKYSDIDEKMEKIEFHLVLSEYSEAVQLLNSIDKEDIETDENYIRYLYLAGFCSIYSKNITDTVFTFNQMLSYDNISDIYKWLAYTGLGISYVTIDDPLKAEYYFDRVFKDIFDYSIETTEDTWRILNMAYICGAFYSKIDRFEKSDRLLEYAKEICLDNQVTYYLAKVCKILANNAIKTEKDPTIIEEYIQDTISFAKLNKNQELILEMKQLKVIYKEK